MSHYSSLACLAQLPVTLIITCPSHYLRLPHPATHLIHHSSPPALSRIPCRVPPNFFCSLLPVPLGKGRQQTVPSSSPFHLTSCPFLPLPFSPFAASCLHTAPSPSARQYHHRARVVPAGKLVQDWTPDSWSPDSNERAGWSSVGPTKEEEEKD